jgi:hypothetical protein
VEQSVSVTIEVLWLCGVGASFVLGVALPVDSYTPRTEYSPEQNGKIL